MKSSPSCIKRYVGSLGQSKLTELSRALRNGAGYLPGMPPLLSEEDRRLAFVGSRLDFFEAAFLGDSD
jgi:hypothetical protein